jgi:Uma2 family endonuclease
MSITLPRASTPPAPPDAGVRPRPWTRQEFHRAAEMGLFGPEERLELLDGEIIQKMTQGGLHVFAVKRADRLLTQAFGPDFHTRVQAPLVLNDLSEPEPDVVVVPGTEFDYLSEHPLAANARLVVEVADTTLRFDRNRKRAAYARSGIAEYWIINLLHRQVEVHRDPRSARYRNLTVYPDGESLIPLHAPHAAIPRMSSR